MWVIRFINGPLTGQIAKLQPGVNMVGRTPDCQIFINHSGVSKNHCQFEVQNNEVIITDLNSRNGTFVNGTKIKSRKLQAHDKIGFYEVMAEVLMVAEENVSFFPNNMFKNTSTQQSVMPPQAQHNLAMNMFPPAHEQQGQPQMSAQESAQSGTLTVNRNLNGFVELAQKYLEEVVLPGIYKLAEWMEFRWVLMCFMGAFIILVTALSAVPLMRILRASIEQESQSHALTIARFIAKSNQSTLLQGMESAVTVDFALNLRGVEKAYIVNIEGRILAPPSMAGKYSDDRFVHAAKQEAQDVVEQIDSDTIGALVPIQYYNPNTGSQSAMAYAVVIYDMGVLAVNDQRTLSLFVQTLFIALVIGAILFYFMYKLIQYPILTINKQMDTALRENQSQVSINFLFPELQDLVSNISSTLTRLAQGGGGAATSNNIETDRNSELGHLVQLIGFPAMGISGVDHTVAAVNSAFEEKTGLKSSDLVFGKINGITDQSLKLSIEDLIVRLEATPDQLVTNELEFSGNKHELVAQTIMGNQKIAYFLVVILPGADE